MKHYVCMKEKDKLYIQEQFCLKTYNGAIQISTELNDVLFLSYHGHEAVFDWN